MGHVVMTGNSMPHKCLCKPEPLCSQALFFASTGQKMQNELSFTFPGSGRAGVVIGHDWKSCGLCPGRACYGVLRFVMENGAKGCEGVLGIKVKIMLDWDPKGKMGPTTPQYA
ncbi:hypothetical protein SO802_018287 [Lithocarpus litseifolius]|uniref:Uncharacterized protein n=1 Tax=Lithocarpus litseifolius TaxID=425828 RepID=A0AAW2CNA9_9ROSI